MSPSIPSHPLPSSASYTFNHLHEPLRFTKREHKEWCQKSDLKKEEGGQGLGVQKLNLEQYHVGRVLIATENPSKIGGEIQLMVDGRKYKVRVEEEGTFRTVSATYQAGNHEANSVHEKEDGEVDRRVVDMDASKDKHEGLVADMELQGNVTLNVKGKINEEEAKESENKEEEAEKARNNGLNDSQYSGKEILVASQGAESLGKLDSGENNNEESINSALGLDSIVQDSLSPLNEECIESAKVSRQLQYTEVQSGDNQVQGKNRGEVEDNSLQCISNIPLNSWASGVPMLEEIALINSTPLEG
ncbi:hypothetical protein RHGRI_000551 [Rhododendron griersonianum]|uniref:Uncharacterized protein n=1 Tax=Rhododendron griersonianum TaxID=479676 RepID=A0AAV6LHY6_9ERIC|nr:hypothetical protein RHGRI_000551 [Rhododendron griersonianum]